MAFTINLESIQVPVIGHETEHVQLGAEHVFVAGDTPHPVVLKCVSVLSLNVPRKGIVVEAFDKQVLAYQAKKAVVNVQLFAIGKFRQPRKSWEFDFLDGGLNLGGSANVKSSHWTYVASGSLSIGSTASRVLIHPYIASGRVRLGGTSIVKPSYFYEMSGGLLLEGDAPVLMDNTPHYSYMASGKLSSGESVTVYPIIYYDGSGGLSCSEGSNAMPEIYYTGSGTLSLGGSADKTMICYYTCSGKLLLWNSSLVEVIEEGGPL